MTEKRFTVIDKKEPRKQSVAEKGIPCSARHCCTRLNRLTEENEQLKKEKETWKSDACSLANLNSILSNELNIAQEQGYKPSKAYKEYIASIKTKYDKFWENKIKHIIND